jgi:hypothetical protein
MAKDRYCEQFKKIYMALYAAQSGIKKENYWAKESNMDIIKIIAHVEKNPNSRSAKALELTDAFLQSGDEKALVRGIHEYGLKKSASGISFFSRSKNKSGIEQDATFFETVKNADKDSRTGKIRESLDIPSLKM